MSEPRRPKKMKVRNGIMPKRLYEISACLNCHVVVSADSEETAMECVATWERAWCATGEIVGVSDVALFDVREPTSPDWRDDAHVRAD